MPFFSCGAIPHVYNRESPAEKMHAHQRSLSSYRKIVNIMNEQFTCHFEINFDLY